MNAACQDQEVARHTRRPADCAQHGRKPQPLPDWMNGYCAESSDSKIHTLTPSPEPKIISTPQSINLSISVAYGFRHHIFLFVVSERAPRSVRLQTTVMKSRSTQAQAEPKKHQVSEGRIRRAHSLSCRQSKSERRTSAGLGFDPDSTLITFHDALADGG